MKKDLTFKSLPISLPSNVLSLTLTLIGFLSFAVPFSLGYPQILVGTIVNAALFSAALFLPIKFIYPVIFLPSLAVLSRGLIFGPLTSFLIIILPFIWISNWLLIFSFRTLINQSSSRFNLKAEKNYWLAGFSAAILKTLFLFSSANILFKINLVPKLFLTTMGSVQFITASLGCGAAFFIKEYIQKRFKN